MNVQFYYDEVMPVLVVFLSTEESHLFEQVEEKTVIQHCLSVLEKYYGSEVSEQFENGFMTKWKSDIYSRGSYSFMAKGALPEDFEVLGEPVDDTLFFCGEATSKPHHGTVTGAVESGEREANRILKVVR